MLETWRDERWSRLGPKHPDPDQRLRVFVDSLATTAESTPENQAALGAGRQLSLEAAINLAVDILHESPGD